MKYGIGVLILIVCMFGYMYKHNKDQHAELQKEHEARIQFEKQNQIDAEQREKQRAVEKQQKEAQDELARLQAQEKSDQESRNKQLAQIKVAEITIKQRLIDADSAKFQNQKGDCGEVNSKNRMGGYVGFSRYIAKPDISLVVIETEKEPISPDWWNKYCS